MSPRYRTLKVPDFPPPPPTPMPTALEQTREDAALGAAWRRCEAALPEGWSGPSVGPGGGRLWRAFAWLRLMPWENTVDTSGPTPTAALNALAERLESLP